MAHTQFVVLRHEMPEGHPRGTHWDWMLELDGRLVTWACERPPEVPLAAVAHQLDDHRLEYLDYEGEISGGRGRVARERKGTVVWRATGPDDFSARLEMEGETWTVSWTRLGNREFQMKVALEGSPHAQ